MTKKLTEQWKDGDLSDEHLYYWRMPNGEARIMNKLGACSYKLCYDGDKIYILAFVPSYDEFKQLVSKTDKLEKKLEIATKALKDMPEMSRAQRALREMEGVK